MIAVVLLATVVLTRTPLGRAFYAVGGNEHAAVYAGISPGRTRFWAYALIGGLAGLCGYLWVSRYAGPHAILRNCVRLCILGGVLLVASAALGSQAFGWLAVTVFGVALGPILPTTLAIARSAFPDEAGIVTGMVIGIANIGGALMPLVLGGLIVSFGAPAGAGLLLALPLAMSLVRGLVERRVPVVPPPLRRTSDAGDG